MFCKKKWPRKHKIMAINNEKTVSTCFWWPKRPREERVAVHRNHKKFRNASEQSAAVQVHAENSMCDLYLGVEDNRWLHSPSSITGKAHMSCDRCEYFWRSNCENIYYIVLKTIFLGEVFSLRYLFIYLFILRFLFFPLNWFFKTEEEWEGEKHQSTAY